MFRLRLPDFMLCVDCGTCVPVPVEETVKRSFLALSLMVLGLSLAACGGAATPTSQPATASPIPADATAEMMATMEATADATAEAMADGTAEAAAASAESAWVCPGDFSGQSLAVYNWADYIGETTVADFERLCNITVNYEFFENNEQVISRLRQGNPGFDVIFGNTYAIEIMIREELLAPIDRSKIPNFGNVATRWLNMPHDPENTYSVPYLWGSMGVAYDTTKITEPIDSWQDVFAHDGPVAWLEDQRAMLGVALHILGYDNSTTNVDEINEAKQFLIDNSDNVKIIAADDGQALLERGEVDIAIEYNGDIYQLGVTCECDRYMYVIPQEGSVADMAAAMIPQDAPNAELAHVFIDYLLDPVVSAGIVNYVAYGTTNEAAIASGIIPQAMLDNPAVFATDAVLATMFFTEDVGAAEQAYNDAWDELKISIGS